MLTLITLRVELSRFIDNVNELLNDDFSMNEDDNWIYVNTNRSFISSTVLGFLPVKLLSYLSLDSTLGCVRLMFDKSDFALCQ